MPAIGAYQYLYPDTDIAPGSFGPNAGPTIAAAIDDVQDAPDGNTTYAQGSSVAGDPSRLGLTPCPDFVECYGATARGWFNNAGAGTNQEARVGIQVGATDFWGAWTPITSSTYVLLTQAYATNPVTGAPWTKPQLDALVFIFDCRDLVAPTDSVRITSGNVEVDVQPIPAGLAVAREQATVYLMARRRPRETPTIKTKLRVLNRELMNDISLVHPDLPHPQGLGAGLKTWERSLQQIMGFRIRPSEMAVEVSLRARDEYLWTYLDGAESKRSSSGTEDGVYRSGVGGENVYTRNSDAWIRDPGSGLFVQIGRDARPIARDGLLLENFATNGIARNAFISNLTGWTPAGTGTNGSSIVSVTGPPDPMFDPSVTDHAALFTAGNPHTADLRLTAPTSISYGVHAKVRIQVWHRDDPGATFVVRIVRNVDGFFWNDATGAWGAGAVNNSMPVLTATGRWVSKRIDVGASATTISVTLQLTSGGTASRHNSLRFIQIEENYWPTSPVVSDASVYSREIQKHRITNNIHKRSLRNAGFTLFLEAVPLWDAADMVAQNGFPTVFDATYDSNNFYRGFWNSGAPDRLDFQAKVAGTTFTATAPWAPVAGTPAKLVFRATSADGEHDLPPRTLSVFVDGVKGTDVQRSGDPTEASPSDLYIGTDSLGNALNAHVHRIAVRQRVYSDAVIARFGV